MKRVLLIDDDQRFLQAMTRELLAHGYRVEEATDGLEGIQRAVQDPPDIAIVDLIMPRVGGGEVVSFFRPNPYLASVPIVLLSGVVLESASAIDAIDADLILSKGPFPETTRLVLDAIDRLTRAARGRRQVLIQEGLHQRQQVVELLRIKRDLRSVLEGAAVGLIELDLTGHVAYANARAEELLGISRASLVGMEILSVLPKAAVPEFQNLLSRFDADPVPMSRTLVATFDDRPVRIVLTSLWTEGARQSIVVTLVEGGSEAEPENRPARLLRYLSHEMRSSLLVIEGSLRTLVDRSPAGQEEPPAEPKASESTTTLSFLAQEVARLLRLLGDASKFQRALRELPDMEMGATDLVSVIKDSISGITALAVPQGVEVSYRGPNEVPKVWGHTDKLLQVLYNLLLNALKFTPRGGRVWVEVAVGDQEVSTTVADTGPGIGSQELKEIMSQAQRAELFLTQKGKRVGLGLSIAHQIVRAHHGQLTAESKPGIGTRFSFTLPRWSERRAAASPLCGTPATP